MKRETEEVVPAEVSGFPYCESARLWRYSLAKVVVHEIKDGGSAREVCRDFRQAVHHNRAHNNLRGAVCDYFKYLDLYQKRESSGSGGSITQRTPLEVVGQRIKDSFGQVQETVIKNNPRSEHTHLDKYGRPTNIPGIEKPGHLQEKIYYTYDGGIMGERAGSLIPEANRWFRPEDVVSLVHECINEE